MSFSLYGWNPKVGSQETPELIGKFGLEFCQENAQVIANTFFQQQREDVPHGHHQMINTEIRLILFFAAKDGEALYSQQKKTRI